MSIALALLLTGCVQPQGGALPECEPDWEPIVVQGATGVTGAARTIRIDCYRITGERQIEAGIRMPPGPDCFAVHAVEVVESSDAVSLEMRIGPWSSPLAGACPEESLAWAVPVELNGPVEGRAILDASVPTD